MQSSIVACTYGALLDGSDGEDRESLKDTLIPLLRRAIDVATLHNAGNSERQNIVNEDVFKNNDWLKADDEFRRLLLSKS